MGFHDTRSLRLVVRPNDLDQLGHVNNAVALEYLEAGRWGWLAGNGLARRSSVVSVVARTEIDYRAELGWGEVEVSTTLESPSAADFDLDELDFRARFRQSLSAVGDGRCAVDALVTVAFVDAQARTLVSLQDFLAASRVDPPPKG